MSCGTGFQAVLLESGCILARGLNTKGQCGQGLVQHEHKEGAVSFPEKLQQFMPVSTLVGRR